MMPLEQQIVPVLAALIFNNKNEILIAQRKSEISQGLKWEFPGGKLKLGETPENCLKREIREELGIRIYVHKIFTAVNHAYENKNILLLAYLSEFLDGNFQLTDHCETKWIKVENLTEYDLSPADFPIAQMLNAQFKNKKQD